MVRGAQVDLHQVTATWGGERPAVDQVSLSVPAGRFAALVGPNGSGKSTVLKLLYGVLAPRAGQVRLGGVPLSSLSAGARARRVGVLLQDGPTINGLSGAELIALGRSAHLGLLGRLGARDRAAIDEAVQAADCGDLLHRNVAALSGGERQRLLLARALATDPEVLVLDEPTNHLDPGHQLSVLALAARTGRTVIAALHSLDLAMAYADQLHVLQRGRLVSSGAPRDALPTNVIREVFGVAATSSDDTYTGRPRLLLHPIRAVPLKPRKEQS